MPAMTDAALTAWIGRTEEAQDHLSHNLLKRIAATLGEPTPAAGQPLPPLWQWCFFQEPVFETGLGVDGHPARGGFLPPADNRNRMWAGGDRKSTRLNSSHVKISYAVFCLKKKIRINVTEADVRRLQ